MGARSNITIGLTENEFSQNVQPGCTKKSYGYRSDGKVFNNANSNSSSYSQGENVGVKFGVGDIVGCGINFMKREIFFTCNGKLIQTQYKNIDIDYEYYPAIGLSGLKEQVTANFTGKSQKFRFDIDQLIYDMKRVQMQEINDVHIALSGIDDQIYKYLVHFGYSESVQAFAQQSGIDLNFQIQQENVKSLQQKPLQHPSLKQLNSGFCPICEKQILSQSQDRALKQIFQEFEELKPRALSIDNNDSQILNYQKQNVDQLEMCESCYQEAQSLQDSLYQSLVGKSQSVSEFENSYETAFSQQSQQLLHTNQYELQNELQSLSIRGELRKHIQEGEIEKAKMLLLQSHFNFPAESDAMIQLDIQQFIEIIRQKEDLKALDFAQQNLNQYKNFYFQTCVNTKMKVEMITALFCYEDIQSSSVGFLLDQNQRELTADVINQAILKKESGMKQSQFQQILRQTLLCQQVLSQDLYNFKNIKKINLNIE